MSDSDNDNESTTDENDTLEDENSQPASGDGDPDGGLDEGGRKSGMGLDPNAEPDEETAHEIEKERAERLDPETRPDNAAVDNTRRDFDVDRGKFTDADDYDEGEPAPFSDPEDPNNPDAGTEGGAKDNDRSGDSDDERAS